MKRLRLFGGISIDADGAPITGRAVQRRRLALLSLLAAAPAQGTSRERLIAFLWPEADAESGRRFLSDSVYRINQALEGDVIAAVGDALRLDPERLPSDLSAFEDALRRGDHEATVGEYAGPFLDGFFLPDAPEFERWVESERDRLARDYARALEALAQASAREGRHTEAVGWWRRLAAQDPLSARIALGLMHALDAAGDRAAAIQHARVHETLLRQELELDPDPAVHALAEQLKTARTAPPAARPDATPSTAPAVARDSEPEPLQPASRDPQPAPVPTKPRRARTARIAAAAAVLAVALGGAWLATRPGDAADVATAPPARSVAVLPFANLSGDRDNEYFSDGITEERIATLGRVPDVRVASRSSVFAYKNKPADVREVGRQLRVAAVLEGSVRRAGDRLRITAQLVNTANGYDIWSQTYDRQLEDVFTIQEEIARHIVNMLVGSLDSTRRMPLAERSTRDHEAYDLYLRGRFAWHRRTREGLADAVRHFEQAIARAPDYARAYVGLADAYAVSAFYDYLRPIDAYPKAEAAALRALRLDPTLAPPHATLGYVSTYYHLDWPRAERELRRALAMDPTYSTAHQWLGNLLTVAGRFDEAERAFRAAQLSDPLSLIATTALGWSYYFAGRYEDAVAQCSRALALNPNFELAHLWGGQALERLGRRDEAREWIGRAVTLSKGSILTRLALAHVLAQSPATADSARAIVREVEARGSRGEYLPSYEVAKIHLALGDADAALRWLERAAAEKSHSRAFFKVDPQLTPLRGDMRFQRIAR